MKSIKDIKINIKLTILFNAIFIVLMAIASLLIVKIEKEQITEELDNRMLSHNQGIFDLIESNYHGNRLGAQQDLSRFENIISEGKFTLDENNKINLAELTHNKLNGYIPTLLYNGESVYSNQNIINQIKWNMNYGVYYINIYQKVGDNYICIASAPNNFIGEKLNPKLINDDLATKGMLNYDRVLFNDKHTLKLAKILSDKKFETRMDEYVPIVISTSRIELLELKIAAMFTSKNNFKSGYSILAESDGNVRFMSSNNHLQNIKEFDFYTKAFNSEELTGKISTHLNDTAVTIFYQKLAVFDGIIFTVVKKAEYTQPIKNTQNLIFLIVAIIVVVFIVYSLYISNDITKGIKKISAVIKDASLGKINNSIDIDRKDEVGLIGESSKLLMAGLTKTTQFAQEIGKGNYESEFELLSPDDTLGKALIEMRQNLIKAQQLEKEHQKENQKQDWVNKGLANFNEVLRTSSNTQELSHNILKNLIDYLNVNQGGLFIKTINDEQEEIYTLSSAIAYSRKKLINKNIPVGIGLVGRCAFEKKSIYITDVPNDYIDITSGLGTANPRVILIVPLISNNEVHGVIELASFNKLEEYKISFVEKLGESIASTLEASAVNERTKLLLEQSKIQSEEIAAQEEEMRQNLEELQATQEDSRHRESEFENTINLYNKFIYSVKYDKLGQIIDINTTYCKFLGLTPADLIGTSIKNEYNLLTTLYEPNSSLEKTFRETTYNHIIDIKLKGINYKLKEFFAITKSGNEVVKLSVLIDEK